MYSEFLNYQLVLQTTLYRNLSLYRTVDVTINLSPFLKALAHQHLKVGKQMNYIGLMPCLKKR